MQRADVDVIQPGDRSRFAMKAVGELREADLDRDLPTQPRIQRAIHDAHPSGIETLFDAIGPDHRAGATAVGAALRRTSGFELRQDFAVGQQAFDLKPELLVVPARSRRDTPRGRRSPARAQSERSLRDASSAQGSWPIPSNAHHLHAGH